MPSETACRVYVHQLTEVKTSHIQQIIQGKEVFLIVDEKEFDNKFLNILLGNIETPEKTYLVDCSIVETVNQAAMSTKIDDCLRSLQVPRENFALLLSDTASYMRACSTTLKVLYPNMFHVTCLAHMMRNCAERVRSYLIMWTDVDNLIARVKAVAMKNKTMKKSSVYRDWQSFLNP